MNLSLNNISIVFVILILIFIFLYTKKNKLNIDNSDKLQYTLLEPETLYYFFDNNSLLNRCIIQGVSHSENGFSWTDGNKLIMCFSLDSPINQLFYIKVGIKGVYHVQGVRVFINNELKISKVIYPQDKHLSITFKNRKK